MFILPGSFCNTLTRIRNFNESYCRYSSRDIRPAELPANDLARFTDRVLLAGDKPQRYGTQFDWFSGEFTLPEPARLAEIDKERASLGLMPLRDYVCKLGEARRGAK